MTHCDYCGRVAGQRKKFHDPRRDDYVERYICSDECELGIIVRLEYQADVARLVYAAPPS